MKSIMVIVVMSICSTFLYAQHTTPLFKVYELRFTGPEYKNTDNPVRDVELVTTWQHESRGETYDVYGFFDGNGRGDATGKFFKVRFCPTLPGKWLLLDTRSNITELNNQHEGHTIDVIKTTHKGFWMPDQESAGKRWYKRSDGTHEYIIGNTMYTFISGYNADGPSGNDIEKDIIGNALYYNKLRFAITGDIYPHPSEKPFLDNQGIPTDLGDYSHRPNPEWFASRVDKAVEAAFEADLITDLILNGPDSYNGRSALQAIENSNDPTPFLRYIAARYGSYPNVWICLSNEYNIRKPKYSAEQIIKFGHIIKNHLPYSTPLSVHPNQMDWDAALNSIIPWNDHIIFQNKIKSVELSADKIEFNYWKGGGNKPVLNDELAYEGRGDNWTEEEVIKAFLGAFLGGGYGSTGHKTGSKLGSYFAGKFDPEGHSASDNLAWFRNQIDQGIRYWEMEPFQVFFSYADHVGLDIFRHVNMDIRMMKWNGKEYVIGGSFVDNNIQARLPEGKWNIVRYDLIAKDRTVLANNISGTFTIDLGNSKAAMVHLIKTE